jgi:hypothetical protein
MGKNDRSLLDAIKLLGWEPRKDITAATRNSMNTYVLDRCCSQHIKQSHNFWNAVCWLKVKAFTQGLAPYYVKGIQQF